MSFIKVLNKQYSEVNALPNLINYCLNDKDYYGEVYQKIINAVYLLNPVSMERLIYDFNKVKEMYNQTNGRQLYHLVISIYVRNMSFDIRENYTRMIIETVGSVIANSGHQCLLFAHIKNDGNIHIHVIINNINYRDGKRLHDTKIYFDKLNNVLKNEYRELCWESVRYE